MLIQGRFSKAAKQPAKDSKIARYSISLQYFKIYFICREKPERVKRNVLPYVTVPSYYRHVLLSLHIYTSNMKRELIAFLYNILFYSTSLF